MRRLGPKGDHVRLRGAVAGVSAGGLCRLGWANCVAPSHEDVVPIDGWETRGPIGGAPDATQWCLACGSVRIKRGHGGGGGGGFWLPNAGAPSWRQVLRLADAMRAAGYGASVTARGGA